MSTVLIKENLINAIPKLLTIISVKGDEIENKDFLFLKKIDCFFPSGKKGSGRKKRKIVEIIKVNIYVTNTLENLVK